MRKKLVAMVMAVTVAAATLAGCGGSDSSGSSAGTEASDSSSGGTESSENSVGGGTAAASGITTEVGTDRAETLIVECQNSTDTPGQFNSYMQG
ncbi:MAG: hypothetical protein K2O13_06890, partial [Lachnospiraceae bacterium]|nr:hypothetical protein [Lachnospiraceae bacterium]